MGEDTFLHDSLLDTEEVPIGEHFREDDSRCVSGSRGDFKATVVYLALDAAE